MEKIFPKCSCGGNLVLSSDIHGSYWVCKKCGKREDLLEWKEGDKGGP